MKVKFCKHHWDPRLVEFQNGPDSGNWTSPLTGDKMRELGIYSHLSSNDKGIIFDPRRGDGMTPRTLNQYNGQKLYIKAPTASKESVIDIWNQVENPRADVAGKKEVSIKEQEASRSPDELLKIERNKISTTRGR